MVNYSQSTSMSRGGFAPSVNYNASIRMPTQPIPELKQPDSKFNIDLSDLGRGLMYAAHQERLAQKEAATKAEKERVAALKAGLGKELNQIQMGVDQNAFSAEAGQRKSREVLDKYIGIGLDPDEIFPIYENAVSTDVRSVFSDRRKTTEDAKNAVNGDTLKELYTAMPSTANWSTEDALKYANANKALGDELSLTIMNGGDIEGVSGRFINAQGHSTVLNLVQGVQSGSIPKEEAKMQIYQSATMAYAKRNPNMSASEIEYLVQKNLKGVNGWIDMLAAAKEGEQKLVADRYDTLTKSLKLDGFEYLSPEDKVRAAFGLLDPLLDSKVFGPKTAEIGTAAVTSPDGRTTTTQKQYLVKDISGNQMLVTAADSEKAIEIMNNASQRVYPEGSIATPYIKQALPQGYASSNIDVQGFTKLSNEDVATLTENRKSVDAISGSVNMRNTLKSDAETIQYIDNQSSITAGLSAYKDVPGIKEIVQAGDNYVRALKGNDVMLANTRINSEGYLVASTDVQGVLGTMQQYITGAKFRDNLDQINNHLSQISPMHRKNVAKLQLASYGISVKDYDPAVDGDMSSSPVFGETVAQKAYEVGKKGWEYGDKYIRKFDEKIFTPLQNQIQEVIKPYLDRVVKDAGNVIEDLKGGEGTYSEYLINNVKEATDDFTRYVTNSIESYKALQAGKKVKGLEDIVNKPNDVLQLGQEVPGLENIVKKPNDALQEFLDVFKVSDQIEKSLAELEKVPSVSDIKIEEKATPKEENQLIKYVEDEVNTLVDNTIDEFSQIMEPLIDSTEALKAGFDVGKTHTTVPAWEDNTSWERLATTLNRIGDKPMGLVRQIFAAAPFAIGYAGGVTWEVFKNANILDAILSPGVELDTGVKDKLLRKAYEVYGEMYRKNRSLFDRVLSSHSKDYLKFFGKSSQKGTYYGNKEIDETNQALMEPFLND